MVRNSPEEDRVRACLACGALVSFHEESCRDCGAVQEADLESDGRVKLCMHCSGLMPYEQIYCGSCGKLSSELEEAAIPARMELEEPLPSLERWARLLGYTALTAGLGVLGVLAWWDL